MDKQIDSEVINEFLYNNQLAMFLSDQLDPENEGLFKQDDFLTIPGEQK